ncbi:MAG: hypothetical protein FWB77_00660 [Treponema sp.]|nr:hypothetical protein [Treponema sp.]
MKKLGLIIGIVALTAVITMTACAGNANADQAAPRPSRTLEPAPPGTERLRLANAGQAIFKFELPAGQTWGNYNKLTVEYMVDAENITKRLRSGCVRLYGNYKEEHFMPDSGNTTVSLSSDSMFANMIIDNNTTNWTSLGAVADEWFTYEYNITGSRAHGQYNKAANLPAASATGPFYFALGLTSQDEGRINAITQLIKNVTLHHATNPTLNVVTSISGFEGNTSAAYYAADVQRKGPAE